MRKKAKYLHDAPNEALMPGIRDNIYSQNKNTRNNIAVSRNSSNPRKSSRQNTPANYFTSQQPQQQTVAPNAYSLYPQSKPQGQMGPPVLQENTIDPGAFSTQSPVSPTFTNITEPTPQNPALSSTLSQPASATPSTSNQNQPPYGSTFFDPSDPALFNFDIASMNFGNHYGALEFGMLGHMATGAGDTPPSDTGTQRGSIGRSGSANFASPTFGESPQGQPFLFGDPVLNEWPHGQTGSRNVYRHGKNITPGQMHESPNAFAIESGPANLTSPSSIESPQMTTTPNIDETNNSNSNKTSITGNNSNPAFSARANLAPPSAPRQPRITTPNLKHQSLNAGVKRRHRNPSTIYEAVKEPYSYTNGFHKLTAFIQRRFSPQKTLQIAKALASIRPSFIATTKTLNQDDLVFMEKCFQRTLWEYEDFINACGTPTIVCRRTGEVAAVGKEFSILTGWKKEILLGKEPNMNINTGGVSAAPATGSSRGSYTPRIDHVTSGRTQPVFLAELLDDDSAIEFYEDFAKLAFGDSRGSVMTTCKLLKYKTQEDMDVLKGESGEIGGTTSNGAEPTSSGLQQYGTQNRKWDKGGISGEAGMNRLGFRDGKVECSYCWTVKRDVFDIPMLIVINVSILVSHSLADELQQLSSDFSLILKQFLPCI